MHVVKSLWLVFVLLFCLPAQAQSSSPWSGEAGLGFLSTSGNSESATLNTQLALVYSVEAVKNSFRATAIYGEQESVRSVERYTLGNQTDLNVTPRDYAFLALDAEKDLFGGVRERTAETVGYGRRLLTGPVHTLNAEIGAGARQTLAQGAAERENETITRLSGQYRWTISETSLFNQTLKVEASEDNTFTETVSELKLSVIGNIFAGISFTVRNNSEVPVDRKKTDTFTAVNLSYKF
jgi:putative salt-induced outer membrane protein